MHKTKKHSRVSPFEPDVKPQDRAVFNIIKKSPWHIDLVIVEQRKLDRGSYGVAYKIKTLDGKIMAMKLSTKSIGVPSSDFIREFSTLKRFAESQKPHDRTIKRIRVNVSRRLVLFTEFHQR